MNGVEAGVGVLVAAKPHVSWSFDQAKETVEDILSAVFVAQVGCEQCGGIEVGPPTPCEHIGACNDYCPAVHVEIPNPYGGVVYADPAKVVFWCFITSTAHGSFGLQYHGKGRAHKRCRWVPRPLEVDDGV